MKIEQSVFSEAKGWLKISDNMLSHKAQLVFLFGNKDLLKQQEKIDHVRTLYPNAEIVGCSTAGEISQETIYNNNIVSTAVWFEKTSVEIASASISSMEESFSIGEKLAESLDKEKLVHIMVLSDGLNINGSELTKGLNLKLNNKASVTGGLAGDQDNFAETVIVHNKAGEKNLVLAIGFYGENLKVGCGSMGGWDSFGVDREVTKSKGNILYELDGQPALELYKRYLGEHAANLPASALLFPLSLRLKNAETVLVRTILSVNEADGSMVFAGDIPQGEYVRLMKASSDKLIDGANDAAEMSVLSLEKSDADLAILISCVGRKLVLKQRVEEELEVIRDILGGNVSMTGFYSYGEICPLKPFEMNCELHNQTMTITLFKEV
ncbi:MAG: FIST signal transduction protein [Bacteroidales bacterium]